jgi:hypothetical protein
VLHRDAPSGRGGPPGYLRRSLPMSVFGSVLALRLGTLHTHEKARVPVVWVTALKWVGMRRRRSRSGRKEKSANVSSSPGDPNVADIRDFAGPAQLSMHERTNDHAHRLVARLPRPPRTRQLRATKCHRRPHPTTMYKRAICRNALSIRDDFRVPVESQYRPTRHQLDPAINHALHMIDLHRNSGRGDRI